MRWRSLAFAVHDHIGATEGGEAVPHDTFEGQMTGSTPKRWHPWRRAPISPHGSQIRNHRCIHLGGVSVHRSLLKIRWSPIESQGNGLELTRLRGHRESHDSHATPRRLPGPRRPPGLPALGRPGRFLSRCSRSMPEPLTARPSRDRGPGGLRISM